MLDLDAFARLVAATGPEWERQGLSYRFWASPLDGRDKRSAGVNLTRGDRELADLAVWDSGEGELTSIDPSGDPVQTHLDGLTVDLVRQVLSDLTGIPPTG